ncbi:MAG: autotransporter outer membrane beta-barrel domain-containing protein, partial [Rhizobiaceae bacterium]
GFNHVSLDTDGFTEIGGRAALTVASASQSVSFTTLGVRGVVRNGKMNLRGMVGWRHGFGDLTPSTINTFSGGTPYTLSGAPVEEDTAVLELGFDAPVNGMIDFRASYTGSFGDSAQTNGLNAQLTGKF